MMFNRRPYTGKCVRAGQTSHAHFFSQFMKIHEVEELHLGTNSIRLSAHYCGAIMHAVRYVNSTEFNPDSPYMHNRQYLNFAYVFQSSYPWEIISVAMKPLDLPTDPRVNGGEGFTYTTGLSYVDGHLVIAYSHVELSVSIVIESVDNVFGHLHTISEHAV
jgi:hypothetical protein